MKIYKINVIFVGVVKYMILEIVFFVILVLLSGFFSSSETAFTSLSLVQIETLVKEKGKRGKLVKKLSQKPDILLTTILIGNNLVNIGASALATQITIKIFGEQALGIMTGILTLIILIFSEVTPKQIAIGKNDSIALLTVRIIIFLSWIFRPFIILVTLVSTFITKLLGAGEKKKLTIQGLQHMVNLAENMGILRAHENQMVKNVFRINSTSVQNIMTHRTKVFSLSAHEKLEDVIDVIIEKSFSRIPVFNDEPENIIGIVLYQDLMKEFLKGDKSTQLRNLMVKPIYVPQTKKVHDLFIEFKKMTLNIAIVLDEYGGLAGIASREDVIEEIFGELYDENEERLTDKIIFLEDESGYRISGDTPFYLFTEVIGLELPHGKMVQTIGGYIVEFLGRIPQINEKIVTPSGEFVIRSMSKNRIDTILFKKIVSDNTESYEV